MIARGLFHSIKSLSRDGLLALEFETPVDKKDLVRFKDPYGRQQKSYEGKKHTSVLPQKFLKFKKPQIKKKVYEFDNLSLNIEVHKNFKKLLKNKSDTIFAIMNGSIVDKNSRQVLSVGDIIRRNDLKTLSKVFKIKKSLRCTNRSKKEIMIRLADYVVKFLEKKKINTVFTVSGGGSIFLCDALYKSKSNISHIIMKQAASFAAESYSRSKNEVGCCFVTTGPGGTNTLTGVSSAWIDSVPVVFISGQVFLNQTIKNTKKRQIGVQEINIIDLAKPITKFAKNDYRCKQNKLFP